MSTSSDISVLDTSQPKCIGIIRLSAIGDSVLATATLQLLEKIGSNAKIYWFTQTPSSHLISSAYPKVECIEISKENTNHLKKEIYSQIDLLVDLQNTVRSSRVVRAFRKINQTGFITTIEKHNFHRTKMILKATLFGRSRKATQQTMTAQKSQIKRMLETLHQGLQYFPSVYTNPEEQQKVLQALQHARPTLPLQHSTESWAQELKYGQWLGISLGATHETKQAPTIVWKNILSRVDQRLCKQNGASHHPIGLLLLGSASERRTSLNFLASLNWHGPVLPLVGKLNLTQSSQALMHCTLFLGNDSGLTHIAEALNIPAGVLFGPTVEGFGFAPSQPNSRAFSTEIGCRPCSRHGQRKCRYQDQLCFHGISTNQVCEFTLHHLGTQ
ncbi:MAG: hypothetical protein OXT67_11380 [Zetaproteobacteria bacterium]|nr:hypothetical protein [Zetaproteobacteria bacterium]